MEKDDRARADARSIAWWRAGFLAPVLALAAATSAPAATLKVASNGTDSIVCGIGSNPPCRSIGQAIDNAAPGSTIIVGPGVYGDIDDSGVLGDSVGEDVSAFAVVTVDKKLTITSRDGAGATVIDAGGAGTNVVFIDGAHGTVFGKPNKGFTVRQGTSGIYVNANDVKVSGNVAQQNQTGIGTSGMGIAVSGNAAVGNTGIGFYSDGTGTIFKGNVARGNALFGIYLGGTAAIVTKNVFVDNEDAGAQIPLTPGNSPVALFSRNALIGNRFGVAVLASGHFLADVAITLDHNDYYANGEDQGSNFENCGVFGQIQDFNATTHTLTINSVNDYWGGAGGPGAQPRDDSGATNPACQFEISGSVAYNIQSPSATEFKILPPAIR